MLRFFGLVLLVVSVVVFVGGIFGPVILPAEALASFSSIFCPENSTLVRNAASGNLPSCVDSDFQRVADPATTLFPLVIIFFAVGLTASLIMLSAAGMRSAQRMFGTVTTATSGRLNGLGGPKVMFSTYTLKPGADGTFTEGELPADMRKQLGPLLDWVEGLHAGRFTFGEQLDALNSNDELASLLAQLERALEQKLITQDEYDNLRKETLDKFV
jgi:hypothetical protein